MSDVRFPVTCLQYRRKPDNLTVFYFLFHFQLITAKLTQISSNMPSSPDSSSDSSTGSPGNHGNHYSDGPNPEVESCLPGVVSGVA